MDHPDAIDPPNPKMTVEERAFVNSLSKDVVQKIDEELMSHATVRNRKVQMLVMLASEDPELSKLKLPFQLYLERIKHLVSEGRLKAEGNFDYMQYSEVWLP